MIAIELGINRRAIARESARIDMSLVQNLVRNPIADAGRERLIEQHCFDRRSASAEQGGQLPGRGRNAFGDD